VLLKRRPVADAIASGVSFREGVIPTTRLPRPSSTRLALARVYVPGLRRLQLRTLARPPGVFDQVAPTTATRDTGALLHSEMKRRCLRFLGPNAVDAARTGVLHQHGVTRSTLSV
jgi:hypothetical protein